MKSLKKLFSFLHLAWITCPSYVVILISDALIKSCNVFLNVYLPKLLINGLINKDNISVIIVYAALIVANNVAYVLWAK